MQIGMNLKFGIVGHNTTILGHNNINKKVSKSKEIENENFRNTLR